MLLFFYLASKPHGMAQELSLESGHTVFDGAGGVLYTGERPGLGTQVSSQHGKAKPIEEAELEAVNHAES